MPLFCRNCPRPPATVHWTSSSQLNYRASRGVPSTSTVYSIDGERFEQLDGLFFNHFVRVWPQSLKKCPHELLNIFV
jgi:hypothetical protein